MNKSAKILNNTATPRPPSRNTFYGNADVGLRGDRPFRVCSTHWNKSGNAVYHGDDQDAPTGSSRFLELYMQASDDRSLGESCVLHGHEFYEFCLVRAADENLHVTEDGETPLVRGEVIILAPGARHGFRPMRGLDKTDMYLQPQWFANELKLLLHEEGLPRALLAASLFDLPPERGLWQMFLDDEETRSCEVELDAVVAEARRGDPSLTFQNGCFLKILSLVNRAFLRQGGAPVPLNARVWTVTARVEECIEQGLEVDVDALAADAALSRRNLDRLFRSETGTSVTEYYQARRVQHAARMLTEPDVSVTDVAMRLNFSDTAHFTRTFKSKTGVTPKAYQSQHAKHDPLQFVMS